MGSQDHSTADGEFSTAETQPAPDAPGRALAAIVKLGALGDVTRTLGLADWLVRQGYEVWWFCAPGAVPLVERCPHVTHVLALGADCRPVTLETDPDVAVSLPHFQLVLSLDEDTVAVAFGEGLSASRRIGLRLEGDAIVYGDDVADWFGMGLLNPAGLEQANAAKRANRRSHAEILGAWVGAREGLPPPRIVPSAEDFARAAELLAPLGGLPRPLVGLAPGTAARWPTKALPASVTARLAGLIQTGGTWGPAGTACLLGGPHDRGLLDQVRQQPGRSDLPLVPATPDLGVYAAVLASCDLVVTSDSLPLHLARAVGTRALACFGPTPSWEIDPGDDLTRLVPRQAASWPCLPCMRAACDQPEFCLDTITDDELGNALGQAWPAAPRTVVTVPTYQEADNVEELVGRLLALPVPELRVLVADDASPDGTGARVAKLAAVDPRIWLLDRPPPRGRGRAGRAAFVAALARGAARIVEMDGDLSHRPEDLPALLAALDAGADLAIGSRRLAGAQDQRQSALRSLISAAARLWLRLILRLRLTDPTSGYRAYSRQALLALDPASMTAHGPEIVEEVLLRARRSELELVEVPITFAPRGAGESKLTPLRLLAVLARVTRLALRTGIKSS